MKVAIFADETGWHTRQLQAALRARGATGRCVDLADCHIDTTAGAHGLGNGRGHGPAHGPAHGLVIPGFGRELPAAALVRGIAGGSFEAVTKRLGVLHALRDLGVVVYNDARAIERSVDKSMTSLRLCAAGVPTPPTWATESRAQAQRIVTRESMAGHSLVLKPLFGSQGKGLQRVGRVNGVHVPLPALDAPGFGGLAYLQRFVPPVRTSVSTSASTPVSTAVSTPDTLPGFDWRVLVIGGRAVAAMRREGTHWVHNLAQGARALPAPLNPLLARTAERAAQALEMDYAGVDLMPGPDGQIVVIEVNGVAAWQGLQSVTTQNIAQAIVCDLFERRLGLGLPLRQRSRQAGVRA